MTTATLPRPYAPPRAVSIPNLDPFFGPDAPMLPDPEPMPDGMQQNPYILHVMQILIDVLADRPNVFVDMNTIVYYDPTNGNRRFQPDVYVAVDVDADAIRRRNGYVIWEAGKPPDFALEVASETTARHDTGRKRDLYARLGIGEYWRFDASGDFYGHRLAGEYLDGNGVYQPYPIHSVGDHLLWGYSPLLRLNLRWNEGWLDVQDPETGAILLDRRGVRLSLEATEQELDASQRRQQVTQQERDAVVRERDAIMRELDAVQQERDAALDTIADYQERVRRLEEQLRGRE